MTNTQRAVREFYVTIHYNSISAKIMFPFFYKKFLKWLGEEPREIQEEKMRVWIAKKFYNTRREFITDGMYLLVPLENRVLILQWGLDDGDPPPRIFIGPLDLMKDGKLNAAWWQKNNDKVKEYDSAASWEREVWKA